MRRLQGLANAVMFCAIAVVAAAEQMAAAES